MTSLDRLQGLRDLGGGGGGFLGHGLDLFLILFIGRGSCETIELGMRRPRCDGKVAREFRLPHRPGDQRVHGELVRLQRMQGVGTDPDQKQDQERRRELDFPGQANIFDPAEHIRPSIQPSACQDL